MQLSKDKSKLDFYIKKYNPIKKVKEHNLSLFQLRDFKLIKPTYYWKKSQSINIKEMSNILFGGISSKFWSFRKQLNMVDLTHLREQKLKLIPFFAW